MHAFYQYKQVYETMNTLPRATSTPTPTPTPAPTLTSSMKKPTNRSSSSSSSSKMKIKALPFIIICDDALSNMISFLDFKSAVRFTRMTHPSIRNRIFGDEKGEDTFTTRSFTTTTTTTTTATTNNNNNDHIEQGQVQGQQNQEGYADEQDIMDSSHSYTTCSTVVSSSSSSSSSSGSAVTNTTTATTMMCYPSLWKEFYKRHLFAPLLLTPSSTSSSCYYINMIKYKHQLLNNLIRFKSKRSRGGSSIKSRRGVSSGLPDSFYSFVPITPTTFTNTLQQRYTHLHHTQQQQQQPPPVDFACTSFIFTSCNTSSEMAYLDPFNGSLTVHDNIMDYAFMNNSKNNNNNNVNNNSSRDDYNQNKKMKEVLIHVQDYSNLNVQDYFDSLPMRTTTTTAVMNNNNNSHNNNNNYNNNINDDEHIIVDWLGIDSHTIINTTTQTKNNHHYRHHHEQIGNMICAARTIVIDVLSRQNMNMNNMNMQQRLMNPLFQHLNNNMRLLAGQDDNRSHELVVTEILAWKKMHIHHEQSSTVSSSSTSSSSSSSSSSYNDHAYICRMDYSPYFIEICPTSNRVYAVFTSDTPIEVPTNALITTPCVNSGNDDCDIIVDRRTNDNNGSNNDNDVDMVMAENDDHSEASTNHNHDQSSDGDNRIFIFPLLEKKTNYDNMQQQLATFESDDGKGRKYFPNIQECIVCDDPVSSVIVDPFGEYLVVGCENGTIELWNVSQDKCSKVYRSTGSSISSSSKEGAIRSQKLDMAKELHSIEERPVLGLDEYSSSFHQCSNDNEDINPPLIDERLSYDSSPIENKEEENECSQNIFATMPVVNDDCHMNMDDNQPSEIIISNDDENDNALFGNSHQHHQHRPSSLPHCKPSRSFNSIEVASHLPLHVGGFIGLQHYHNEGTTLSYWHYQSEEDRFKLASLINLPLSPQPKPQVSFDGKRIIVFGQDHIGVIILVYKVLSSSEDCQEVSEDETSKKGGKRNYDEGSGGVINFSSPQRIEYSNRIRHCGLGGFEYYDFMFLSANERFIAVNTKTGNLLSQGEEESQGPNQCEGLFMIDLEEGCII